VPMQLALDPRLRRAARFPSLPAGAGGSITALEIATLLGAGVLASLLTNVLRLRLGIPGSSIVFTALPMALGFALVPRRGAGVVMTGGALAANAALAVAGVRLDGIGAQTSLLLTGPLLDLALAWLGGGWRLYAAFVAACTASNALAFVVRGITRAAGLYGMGGGSIPGIGAGGGGPGRTFAQWWPHAVWTYALAGLLAGLISAAPWFRLRERSG
jgi:hypothetical protein